ncbi:MAG TPA: serine hydrolase, partial [Longimicrobiales bacterium]|nr:serine hydrolase [Longimicrobiales bacterium]
MTTIPCRRLVLPLLALALAAPPHAAAQDGDRVSAVDAVFARWDSVTTPGCAVGVSLGSETVLERAYGMAELEQGIANTPATIFENGSVSKQFTAAAVVLLALEGKLSLDDDVRRWVPELPDYGQTIRLRHLLNHTSGLRDWGSVAEISGWGRSDRTHTHAHVLDILRRQSALNFEPGHEYSYSNSGYNLLAIIVERVSGVPFARFSAERIFGPVGMSHTQWRDDYRRIVPGRSAAYQYRGEGGYVIDRPIENVHGNGGLLTTVGDLLIWTRSLQDASLAGPEFVEIMQEQGLLNDGRTITYASGLVVDSTLGVPSVSHSGSTSGYRAHLGRFPEQGLAVAVLCNVGAANASQYWTEVSRVFLGDAAGAARQAPEGIALPEASLRARAGLYRDRQTGFPERLAVGTEGTLRMGRTPLVPVSETEFLVGASGRRLIFAEAGPGGRAPFRILDGDILVDEYVPEDPVDPTPAELAAYVGTYHSDDAEATFRVTVDEGRLVVHRRPADRFPLVPSYRDAFQGGPGVVRFLRGADGEVTGMSLGQSR